MYLPILLPCGLYLGKMYPFICGYEEGCLGYPLYHQLTEHHITCVILASATMPVVKGKKKIKTDKRDARNIAKCLAHHDYSPVYVPTNQDEQVKDYIRMRDDHKLALKKVKQEISAFCLRHNLWYDGRSTWTATHIQWLKDLKPEGLYQEILEEYLLTLRTLMDKIERLDRRIEELSPREEYHEKTKQLSCFLGIKTHTALAVVVETGDFKRFSSAEKYACCLGLVPGEKSSGPSQTCLGITKAGNRAEVIAYADKANERLRRKYYRLVLSHGKSSNVAKTAIARELSCFIWGMMTGKMA